jgi:tight adherence protein B
VIRLRVALLAIAVLFCVVTSTVPAAAAESVRLVPLHGTAFPDRAFVLSLPEPAGLTPDAVTVRENGRVMHGVSLVPASQASDGEFGVVLLIDASRSMKGAPIQAAVAAARAFVEQRNPSQQIAIVTFNSRPTTLLPFTTDQGAIDNALATVPALASGTHIYDAVEAGIALLRQSSIRSGSIVLLSDGSDTGSAAGEGGVSADAQRAGTALFAVGLRSGSFDPSTLTRLASETHGEYSEAGSARDLARIYQGIGQRLASQYVIRYRSAAPAGQLVRVHVGIRGYAGGGDASYSTPGSATSGTVYHRPFSQWFWQSNVALTLTVILISLMVGWIASSMVRPRGVPLRHRMAEFVTLRRTKSDRKQSSVFAEKLGAGAERSLERTPWWARFKDDFELSGIGLAPGQFTLLAVLGSIIVAWLAVVVTGFAPAAVLGLGVVLVARAYVVRRVRTTRQLFAEQLPDNLQVLASAMRAGHSFIGALAVVVEDSPEPSRSEFKRVIADEQLGVSLDDALGRTVDRMENKDLGQIALVAALQRDTGGNTAEVLDRVTETIRERFALRRLVKTLTAQGRMSRWIVSGLPIVLALAITAINPSYLQPLVSTSFGRVLVVIACLLVVAGSLIIKRIVNIKV